MSNDVLTKALQSLFAASDQVTRLRELHGSDLPFEEMEMRLLGSAVTALCSAVQTYVAVADEMAGCQVEADPKNKPALLN